MLTMLFKVPSVVYTASLSLIIWPLASLKADSRSNCFIKSSRRDRPLLFNDVLELIFYGALDERLGAILFVFFPID